MTAVRHGHRRGRWALVGVALAAVLGGCTATPPAPDPTLRPAWRQITLPGLSAGERPVIRAAATCQGRWYLTGSIAAADGTPRPAVWTSTDARRWTPVPVAARSYYGRMNTVSLAGCRDGRLAAIGWQTGGAHGFPRYSGWFPDASGALAEIDVPYTLFAGPEGVNVTGMAVGARGFLLSGNRTGGAADWVSPDGARFRINEPAAGLSSDGTAITWASDALATPQGWVIVGAATSRAGANRDPAVWTSPDGSSWTRLPVPGTPGYEDPRRVAAAGSTLLAVGLSGPGYATWRGTASGGWSAQGHFGSNGAGAGTATSLVTLGDHAYATISDADAFGLWISDDLGSSWRGVALPAAAPARAGTDARVFSDGRTLLLSVDDGTSGRLWLDPDAAAGR